MFSKEIIANSYPLHELLSTKWKYLCWFKEPSVDSFDNKNQLSRKPKVISNNVNSVIFIQEKEVKLDVQLYHEIKILLSCMTTRVCMNKFLQTKSIRTISTLFYDTIYKYSHKKMKKLIKLGCFRLLFFYFTQNGALDEMCERDKTLSKNAIYFKESAKILLNLSH